MMRNEGIVTQSALTWSIPFWLSQSMQAMNLPANWPRQIFPAIMAKPWSNDPCIVRIWPYYYIICINTKLIILEPRVMLSNVKINNRLDQLICCNNYVLMIMFTDDKINLYSKKIIRVTTFELKHLTCNSKGLNICLYFYSISNVNRRIYY
jgi:hypothetical protein